MGEILAKEKKGDKKDTMRNALIDVLKEYNLLREDNVKYSDITDPNYNPDTERKRLRQELSKIDLGKPLSEIIIEDRR